MILQGLKTISSDKPNFFFSDDLLKSWIGNPQKFAKDVLNVELQDYQKQMIDLFLNKKRVCVSAGRASGKSFCLAIFLLYNSIVNPNQKQLIISPAERQSRLLFGMIHSFVARSEDLFNSVNFKKSNLEILKFTNGSEIIPLPSTTFIRGFQNINFIVCDEAAFFLNPEQVFASIEPMLSLRNIRTGEYGTLILVSSPNGCLGKFWDCFNSPHFARMQISAHRNRYISKKWLEEQKQIMSAMIYQQEILGMFTEATDNFFSVSVIDKCSQNYDFLSFPEPDKSYVLGVDIGRVKDSSVLCVISIDSDNIKKVENIVELNDKPFSLQINHIKYLHEKYRFSTITIEKAGLSMPVVEKLQEMNFPIKEFIPTLDNKSKAYNFLLKEMEQGKVIIPLNHTRLQYQLRTFRYEVNYQGKMKLHHASEVEGDDFVDSFCFSLWSVNHVPVWCNISDASDNVIQSIKEAREAVSKPMTWHEKEKWFRKTASYSY